MAITDTNSRLNKLIGNKYFHSKFSNWSTRNLGKVQRNHMIKKIRKMFLQKTRWTKECNP